MYDIYDVGIGFGLGLLFSFVSFSVTVWFKTLELRKDSDRADLKSKTMVVES